MSTKIHNGYRISDAAWGRPDPFEFLDAVRTQMEATYRHEYTDTLARIATAIVDQQRHAPTASSHDLDIDPELLVSGRQPVWTAQAVIDQAQDKAAKGLRVPGLDFQCEMTLYRDPANPAGPMYAQLYVELGAYRAAFESLPGVEKYGYWNNTDGPDGVSAQEWDDRARIWDRILGRKAPCGRGLSWTMLGPAEFLLPPLVSDDILAHVPDDATRARHLAGTIARQQVYKVEAERAAANPGSDEDIFDKAERVIAEVRHEAAKIHAQTMALLAPITLDDLFGDRDRR